MDCVFCKISKGEIPSAKIYEDGDVFAFMDINPINPGHALIIPKKHVESVFDSDPALYAKLFGSAKSLSAPIQRATGAKRIGMIVEGFLVSHAHIHLVPINGGGELDFRRARKARPEELEDMARKIKDEL